MLCFYTDLGEDAQLNPNCNDVFKREHQGLYAGPAKFDLANLKKWADYLSAKEFYSQFPNDRRQENWHILADNNQLKDLLKYDTAEDAKYPISVIVHELAWFLIDQRLQV